MAKFPGAVQYPVRWWGFPTVRAPRRIKPTVLMVVHQTGNQRLPSAIGEATYSNRDGSGASFTFANNRDGTLVQCLDPVTQTPWTNGDLKEPSARVKRIIGTRTGYSFNEFCFMTVESVAYLNSAPITAAQIKTLAKLAAWGHELTGLPINRDTILGHRDINSVDRWNCPTTGDLDKFLQDIIDQANEIVGGQDMGRIEDLEADLARCRARAAAFRTRAITAEAELAKAVSFVDAGVEELKQKVAAFAADIADD